MGSEPNSPTSLKKKFKSSLWISGCFAHKQQQQQHQHNHLDNPSPTSPLPSPKSWSKSPRLIRTLSKSHDKCRSLIHRIGGVGGGWKHVRRHSADFHYDALSYALKFDSGCEGHNLDEFPMSSFSARLPRSPPLGCGEISVVHNI